MNRPAASFEKGGKGPQPRCPCVGSRKEVTKVSDERYRGAAVRTLPRPNRRYGAGRVCAAPGCQTKLSVYNKWNYCWQHEPVHSYIPRGKRKSRAAA